MKGGQGLMNEDKSLHPGRNSFIGIYGGKSWRGISRGSRFWRKRERLDREELQHSKTPSTLPTCQRKKP